MRWRVFAGLTTALLLSACNQGETVRVAPPPVEGTIPAPPPVPVSRVRVPVSITLETLRRLAEAKTPSVIADSKGLQNFGPTAGNSVSWNLHRSPIVVSGIDGRLVVRTSIGGTVTVKGSIKPIGGDVGRFLGGLAPSQPFSQSADVGADIEASAAPRLQADWSVAADIQAKAWVREASARIVGIFDLSFRGELQGPVDDAVGKAVADINRQVAADRTLRNAAAAGWAQVCQPVPVPLGNGLSDLALHVSPQGFTATQPVVDAQAVSIGLGLDATIALVPAGTFAASCPAFPDTLALTDRVDDRTGLAVTADLDYPTLNQALERARSSQPQVSAPGVTATIDSITLSPHGDALLLAVAGTFGETRFFGASAKATIYLTARPVLDAATQTLRLQSVALSTESREALGKVAGVLASALGPAIESWIEAGAVDLTPQIKKARLAANAAAAVLKAKEGPVRFREVTLDSISLAGLWYDATAVHVLVAADGRVVLEAAPVPP